MEVTGLSYGELMIQAAIPFAVFWLAGAWVGANRAQKRTFGKEGYALGEDVQHLDQVVITPRQKRTTVAFLISFVLLVGYGIATKQGTNYALMVMIVLAAVVAIFGGIEIDRSVDCITKGVASQANMFLIFVSIDVLLNLVTLGGGFDALSNLLGGLAGNSPTAVMLVASVVGGFGIEAAAVAEIQIITDMFGGLATQVGLPMGCFAVSILAATWAHRLRLSHHQLCRPAGHRPVQQHQGGPPGLLDQRCLCLRLRGGVLLHRPLILG